MAEPDQKDQIQRAIVRARDGIGDHIDELDRHVRAALDPRTFARSYAPQLIAGGAVLGMIVGFGLPRTFRRLVAWGVPIAIAAVAIKHATNGQDDLDRFTAGG